MTRFTITMPVGATGEALVQIRDRLMGLYGGYTEHSGFGGWKGDDAYQEAVHIFTVDVDRDLEPNAFAMIHDFCAWLARKFNQEAVYMTTSEIHSYLVEPEIEDIIYSADEDPNTGPDPDTEFEIGSWEDDGGV